jgi:hypothetical protein
MALEWLDGEPLDAWLAARRGHPVREAEAVALLRPAIEGLAFAHAEGVAHRDVKPANIFVVSGRQGRSTKMLDFGIAKAMQEGETATQLKTRTSSGFSAFSPSYGAPEQFLAKRYGPTGPWTDVHALGLILTEMTTGRPALEGEEQAEFFIAATSDVRPTPSSRGGSVSNSFEIVCRRALACAAADRYRNAEELLTALDMALSGPPVAALPNNPAGPPVATVLPAPAPAPPFASSVRAPQLPVTQYASAAELSGAVAPAQPWAGPASTTAPVMQSPRAPPWAPAPPARPATSRSPVALVVGLAGGVVLLGGIGWAVLASRGHGEPAAASSNSAVSTPIVDVSAPSAAIIPTPEAAAPPALVKVRITSMPDGASVKEDGVELCSSTPCDILYRGADADPTREHRLTVLRTGYRPETKSVKVTDNSLILVKLTPLVQQPKCKCVPGDPLCSCL